MRVFELMVCLMKGGLDMSHSVYPRASNVDREPPLGNEEASGSPLMSSLPEKCRMISPSRSSDKKASCFSAEPAVMGKNQCE
jgi:hypothetical protein